MQLLDEVFIKTNHKQALSDEEFYKAVATLNPITTGKEKLCSQDAVLLVA